MSIIAINVYNPVTDPTGSIPVGISGKCLTLYLLNESLESQLLTTNDDRVVGILPALWAQPFIVQNPGGNLNYVVISSQNAEDTTLQQVQGAWYDSTEDTSKLFSGPLPRIANVGNPASVSSTVSGGTLVNTGNGANTQVVQLASTGAAGNSWTVTNDGLLALAVTIAGALVQVLKTFEPGANGTIVQIGAATYLAEVLGNLIADGTLESKGAFTADGTAEIKGALTADVTADIKGILTAAAGVILGTGTGDFIESGDVGTKVLDCTTGIDTDINATNPASGNVNVVGAGTGGVYLYSAGSARWHLDSSGNMNMINGTSLTMLVGGLSRMSGNKAQTCGSGTTITHGLGTTPFNLVATPNIAQAGSATVGIGNIGATTFQCTVGAGTSVSWWAKY